MKKLLLLAMIMASMTSYAEGWHTVHQEADELTGQKEGTEYSYELADKAVFTFNDNDIDHFCIISPTANFDYEISNDRRGQLFIFGIYDETNTLVDKIKLWLDSYAQSGHPEIMHVPFGNSMIVPVGQKKKVKKIINHIHEGRGYVRIIGNLYGAGTYDVKVKCLQDN